MNISFYSDKDSKGTKETKRVYRWRKKEPTVSNLLEIDQFSQPSENVGKCTPLTYFRKFWSDDITLNGWLIRHICTVWKKWEKVLKLLRKKWKGLLGFKCDVHC